MKYFCNLSAVLFSALLLSPEAQCAPITINFDGVADFTGAPGLYSSNGVDFSGGNVFVSAVFGGGLNELEFPPRSAEGVFVNDANETTITFASAIISFQAFFTYGGPVNIGFYDSSNTLLNSLASQYLTNLAISGDPGSSPNEELSINNLSGVTYARILATGADFAMDDLTVVFGSGGGGEGGGGPVIPEPSTVVLTGAAVVYLVVRARKYSR